MATKLRKLNIEVTTRCNLDCEMCARTAWQEGTGDMSLNTYMRLLPVFPEIESVGFLGLGEPLLNEHLMEMIRLAKTHLPPSGAVGLTTNATLIDEYIAAQLVASGLDDIVVSIDSADADAFSVIRQGANLDSVLGNLKLLGQAKKDTGSDIEKTRKPPQISGGFSEKIENGGQEGSPKSKPQQKIYFVMPEPKTSYFETKVNIPPTL